MRKTAFGILQLLRRFVITLFVVSLFAKWILPRLPAEWEKVAIVEWWRKYEDEIPALALVIVGLVEFACTKVRDPEIAQELQDLLDGIRERYQPSQASQAKRSKNSAKGKDKNGSKVPESHEPRSVQSCKPLRATIFRYRAWSACLSVRWWWLACLRPHGRRKLSRFRMPWSGWMIPEARSGDSGRMTRTVFFCPSDGEDEAEGIAGQCRFAAPEAMVVSGLPEVMNEQDGMGIANYARQGHVSEVWVRARLASGKHLPRGFLGIAILVDGELWGALVLDSEEPDRIHQSDDRCDSIMMTALVATVRRL